MWRREIMYKRIFIITELLTYKLKRNPVRFRMTNKFYDDIVFNAR